MKKCILFFAAIWMTLCFCSCDDGRIYEKEIEVQRGGRVLKLTGRFSGISNWTDDYSVVVAGFNDKSEYAVITKSLPVNVTDGTDIVMTLGGISDEVKSLKLCVISRLRECIVEFKTMEDEELAAITDTILMDVGTLHLVLNRAGDTSMNHTDMLSEDEQPLLKLIDNWINEGIFLNNE